MSAIRRELDKRSAKPRNTIKSLTIDPYIGMCLNIFFFTFLQVLTVNNTEN